MLIGSHVIIHSRNADADRALLRDVLKLGHIDVGGGWLIFGLPPSEVAVHPTEGAEGHELYLMCQDVEAFIQTMREHALACSPIRDEGWGLLTHLSLPGGGKLGVYQPRHARPKAAAALTKRHASSRKKKSSKRSSKKSASRRARTRR
jgi:hypothetical protein